MKFKHSELTRLVRQLVDLTGENAETAVERVIAERLEKVKYGRDANLAERHLEIGRDCAGRLKEPYRSQEHGRLLYGDNDE